MQRTRALWLLLAMTGAAAAGSQQRAPPPAGPIPRDHPPPFGSNWTARLWANLTQVGFDAGSVMVSRRRRRC